MSAATLLEQNLAAAVRDGKIPHAVVCAADRDGSFHYSHAVGKTSVDSKAGADIQDDAVFLLASQTKLITATAAMLVVERGLIAFDDDVAGLLPELGGQKVLTGFEDDGQGGERAVLEERKGKITLRHLLTHTAGTAYDAADPDLIKYQSLLQKQQQQQQQGDEADKSPFAGKGTDVVSRFTYPLIFQPGEAWSYGSALDWAGLLVERLTNSTLEEFMRANIWGPLGLHSMTFFPAQKEGLQTRVPELSVRGPDGNLYPFREPFINAGMTGCAGGQGGYSSMGDYVKFMQHLLRNDGTILRPESVDELFESQLTASQAASLKEYFTGPKGAFFIGEFDLDRYEHGWSFGGILFLQGYEDGRRRARSVSWGGVANCFWLLDREAGVALTFGTQVIPPGDLKVAEVITLAEKGVYQIAGAI